MTPVTQEQPKRRRMPAAERREEILDAALDEFATKGFHETSLDGVAERAGISKALIYEHFASKRDLHDALLGRYSQELLEGLIAASTRPGTTEDRLRAGVDAFLGFVEENREPWRLMVRNPLETGTNIPVARAQAEMAHAIATLAHGDVPDRIEREEGAAEAELRVELLAQQLVGAMRGMAIWWDAHREVPRTRLVQALMNFCWIGVQRVIEGERWEP